MVLLCFAEVSEGRGEERRGELGQPWHTSEFAEVVVGQLEHEGVVQCGRCVRAHRVSAVRVEVGVLDAGVDGARDANHPDELVDVVARVPGVPAEEDHDVVHAEEVDELVRALLVEGEDLADGCDVCVVPRVVVHEDGSVRHLGHLVAVVPPRHDSGVFWCVVGEPAVALAEIVEDHSAAVWLRRGEDDGRGRVRLGRHPDTVADVRPEEDGGEDQHDKAELSLEFEVARVFPELGGPEWGKRLRECGVLWQVCIQISALNSANVYIVLISIVCVYYFRK